LIAESLLVIIKKNYAIELIFRRRSPDHSYIHAHANIEKTVLYTQCIYTVIKINFSLRI